LAAFNFAGWARGARLGLGDLKPAKA
jgi:hypothetical protein